jgi:type II secretory ATPase GspE/PulE/Tfp pilus assembly ATPase PilB-like protein
MHNQPSLLEARDVLHYMDVLLEDCIRLKISDLHFEPYFQDIRLRIRIDGRLKNYTSLSSPILKKICQRFKALANLNITAQKTPQDGQWLWQHQQLNKSVPCRLSTCPVLYGEKLVVRLLQHPFQDATWFDLGMNREQASIIEKHLHYNQGLILVNGPTGSGKTTTLYTALNYLSDESKNIVSIEDPIEIPFPKINQIELVPQQGFKLSQTLRVVLRQDPDIILIGEIRDEETAKLSIEASQTGHLVFSSLHSHDCLASIERLKHLGVCEHDIENNIHLVIAQKLIPTQEGKQLAIFEFLELDADCPKVNFSFQEQLFELFEKKMIDYPMIYA